MKAAGPDWVPRTIPIVCTEPSHEPEQPELASLVSYEYEGLEWWDADERAHQASIIPDTAQNRARPDLAKQVADAARRFKIRCPICGLDETIGDLLGAGYRSADQIGQQSGAAVARLLEKQRRANANLSTFADYGEPHMALSALRVILNLPHSR